MAEQTAVAGGETATKSFVPRIAGGIAVLCLGFLGAFFAEGLGLNGLRPALPAMMVIGTVILGTGIHRVLWAPPRDASSIPSSVRPVISAVLAVAAAWCTSFILGVVAAVIRASR
jgi:hypothetical protein